MGGTGGQVPPGGAQGSRGDGLARASASQRLLQGWVETPFLERLSRARGCGVEPLLPAWALPCSGEALPPDPAALLAQSRGGSSRVARAHLGLDQGPAALQAEAELFRFVEARLAQSAARAR